MLSKNNYYYIDDPNVEIISKNNNIFYKIKSNLIGRINKIRGSNYLYTFILGDNSKIDPNIKKTYNTNGISHLFSVSGMHITLISSIILFILNKFKNSNLNYIFVILFLIFFMFLTNFSASVIRSVFLFIFLYLNKTLKLSIKTYKILIYICVLALIINPYNIHNVGFIFSYTISFYLILFSSLINKYNNYFKKLFITSFISFLVSIPILINNYYSINIFTIVNNIIFVPLVSIMIFPFSIITLIFPRLDFMFEFLINILEKLSLYLINFKIEIILCHINIFIVIFYFIVITFILYKLYYNKYKYLFILIIVLFIHTNFNYINKESYITFIDVEQGDSAFIHLPNNKGNVLIDTGGSFYKDYSNNIISYLKSEGIKRLDYLLITHGGSWFRTRFT